MVRGALPEDPAEIEHWQQEMAAYHERNMKRKGLPVNAGAQEHLEWWERQLLHQE
ncbi:hypothetical protein JXO52_09540 [bacterium]|nr:hypothetical protein [bacterium]